MQINADFSKRAIVHGGSEPWVASPMPGVDRRMLDRIGNEVARATSIVRYAKGSKFSAHTHSGGEEFLVLEGTFQDEHGDYPAGTYVRNPPTSHHTPGSDDGCVIFVKLWQFDPNDRNQFSVDTNTADYQPMSDREGVSRLELHKDQNECVGVETWAAGAAISLDGTNGMELLVLDGGFALEGDQLNKHAWLRLPPGDTPRAVAGPFGARVWIKSGHLASAPKAPAV